MALALSSRDFSISLDPQGIAALPNAGPRSVPGASSGRRVESTVPRPAQGPAQGANGAAAGQRGESTAGRTGSSVWLELLASGLTFDLAGLAPGNAEPLPARAHQFGLAPSVVDGPLEAITLTPGPHLVGGGAMLPVVRCLAWLAARLAVLPGTRAVAWHSARCWSAPQHYRDVVLRWMEGGAFPGFGLAALLPMADGGLQSEGLTLFIGQELRIEPELVTDRAAAAKIALRLMHVLVENGPIRQRDRITLPPNTNLLLEPSANGRFVRVWRD